MLNLFTEISVVYNGYKHSVIQCICFESAQFKKFWICKWTKLSEALKGRGPPFFSLFPLTPTQPLRIIIIKKNSTPPKSTEHYWPTFSCSVLETAHRYITLPDLVCKFYILININSYRSALIINRNAGKIFCMLQTYFEILLKSTWGLILQSIC